MEIGDTVDAVKKYWPWALGGVAALFLLSRLSGGGGEDDGSGNLSGSLYDPNLLQNNLAMSQIAAGIRQAEIVADAQNNQAGWATMQAGFQFASNANSDFQAGQIASYMAVKDISISAMQNAGDIAAAGLTAAGQSTASFNSMIGQSNQAAGNIVSSVAHANANSQQAFASVARSVMSYGMM